MIHSVVVNRWIRCTNSGITNELNTMKVKAYPRALHWHRPHLSTLKEYHDFYAPFITLFINPKCNAH